MTDPNVPLPPLYEAVLDDEGIDSLFFDVSLLSPPAEVLVKSGPTLRADEAPVSLAGAREALRAGRARGVQLRYVHEGRAWCDTLLRLPEGARLVRMELPASG